MGLFKDLSFLRRLGKIAKVLGASERNLSSGRYDLAAAKMLSDDKEQQAACEELFRLLLSNPSITRVLDHHQVGEAELRDLQDVVQRRIGGWVGQHYLPVHALGFPMSLHFLLSHGYYEYAHKQFTSPFDEVQLAVKDFFERGAPPNYDFGQR